MTSGRRIRPAPTSWAALAFASLALLAAGCGSSAEHSSDAPAVKAGVRARCVRLRPPFRLGPAPTLTSGQLASGGASMIRLCRFAGNHALPPRPLKLVRRRDVRARAIVQDLIRELNRLPPMPAAISCPNDDLSQIVLLLSYPGGRSLTIGAGLSGCETVTNGSTYRTAARGRGPRLIAQLERLTARA